MKASYIYLAILWGVYFSFHSLLARQWVKQHIYEQLRVSARLYRMVYSVTALAGLLALLFYTMQLSAGRWFHPFAGIRFISLMLASWGVIIIRLCFRQYSWKQFIGFEEEKNGARLETGGLLKYVRHPMYAGTILIITGFWLYVPTTAMLITSIVTIVYIFVGIRLEERSLVQKFGTQYEEYKKKVPMLVPFLRRRS
jgi:protein-S-isoprenylcysteine O-methyltransferase Ste14